MQLVCPLTGKVCVKYKGCKITEASKSIDLCEDCSNHYLTKDIPKYMSKFKPKPKTKYFNNLLKEIKLFFSPVPKPIEKSKNQNYKTIDFQLFSPNDLISILNIINKTKPINIACPKCGWTLLKLNETGRVGCNECYNVFKSYLLPSITNYHSANKHIGKKPKPKSRVELIEEIQVKLQEAIKNEQYEDAAKLRDELKKINSKKDLLDQ